MSTKWIVGGAVGAMLLVIGAAGSVTIQRMAPRAAQDSALPGFAQNFMASCRSAVRERNSGQICKCMLDGFDGALRTEDEYRLAGAIVKAIVQSGPNKARMQANFNGVSQDFHGVVSIERKAAVLRVVSAEGLSCGKAQQ